MTQAVDSMNETPIASPTAFATPDLSLVWPYFGNIPEPYQAVLEPAFQRVVLNPGERLIQQGQAGDELYIVLSGKLRVIDEELDESNRLLTFKEPGEGVGEIALLTGERRTASVDAVVVTKLVALSRRQLETVTQAHPEAYQSILAAIRHRVHQSRLNHVLIKTHLFKNLAPSVLQDLQAELELLTVASGDVIMATGETSDALFIVIGGRLRVVGQTSEGEQLHYLDIQRGQTVGEMGLITGEKRTATVFALRDSLLARLSRASFQQLLQKHPEAILAQFVSPVIERLRHQLTRDPSIAGTVTTITLIPTSQRVPLGRFAAAFGEALQSLGSTLHLNGERCDRYLNTEGIAYLAEADPQNDYFVFWLNQQEASHDYVVYEADVEPTAWTRRCIRQADLVLIVGMADGSPELGAIETGLLAAADKQAIIQCLVLLHENDTQLPQNTAAWLAHRQVRNHYHVCLHKRADFARISRLLTGQGVGLVLSGGGARAFAHIGVIRALVEQGVPIDAIGGVSGGSIVAGLWAMERDAARVLQRCQTAQDRIDYTIPLHALTTGKNWTKSMASLFGNVQIEDVWTTFFCISANVTQAQLVTHESGSLMHGVRASTAIPGILPPVFHEGDILVDGGLINNLPTDIMKARPDIGRVIAVDVGLADKTRKLTPFDYYISGWRSLWQRINPWAAAPQFPTIGEVLLRSISITNAQTTSLTKRIVDLYLGPPVQSFGLMDFDKITVLAGIGYEYGMKAVQGYINGLGKGAD